jgi:hypothetical protein
MTDEKKKPDDEVSDEQLEDVAGGAKIGSDPVSPIQQQQQDEESQQQSKKSPASPLDVGFQEPTGDTPA